MRAEVGEEEEIGEAMAATEIEASPRNDIGRSIKRNDDHQIHRQAVEEVAAEATTTGHLQNHLMAPTAVGDADSEGNPKKLMK